MMNVNDIEKEIKKYNDNKKDAKLYWKNKEISLANGEKFCVNGFGVCENDDFSPTSYRYYLEFEIINSKGNKGSIASIMMNPSDQTNPDKQTIDSTVTNVIKMAYLSGYSKVIILNSFPYINGNGNESLTTYDELTKKDKDKISDSNVLKINKDFIANFLENQDKQDILLAWGGDMKNTKNDYTEILKKYEDKIYVYNITKNNFPMHPSPYNQKEVDKIINAQKQLKKVQLITEGKRRTKLAVQ